MTNKKTQEGKQAVLGIALGVDFRKVTCSKCSRRRDLYFVGETIYCVDDAFTYLTALLEKQLG